MDNTDEDLTRLIEELKQRHKSSKQLLEELKSKDETIKRLQLQVKSKEEEHERDKKQWREEKEELRIDLHLNYQKDIDDKAKTNETQKLKYESLLKKCEKLEKERATQDESLAKIMKIAKGEIDEAMEVKGDENQLQERIGDNNLTIPYNDTQDNSIKPISSNQHRQEFLGQANSKPAMFVSMPPTMRFPQLGQFAGQQQIDVNQSMIPPPRMPLQIGNPSMTSINHGMYQPMPQQPQMPGTPLAHNTTIYNGYNAYPQGRPFSTLSQCGHHASQQVPQQVTPVQSLNQNMPSLNQGTSPLIPSQPQMLFTPRSWTHNTNMHYGPSVQQQGPTSSTIIQDRVPPSEQMSEKKILEAIDPDYKPVKKDSSGSGNPGLIINFDSENELTEDEIKTTDARPSHQVDSTRNVDTKQIETELGRNISSSSTEPSIIKKQTQQQKSLQTSEKSENQQKQNAKLQKICSPEQQHGKISYTRELLLQLRYTNCALSEPNWIATIPGITLEEPNLEEHNTESFGLQNAEYVCYYKWMMPAEGKGLMKDKKTTESSLKPKIPTTQEHTSTTDKLYDLVVVQKAENAKVFDWIVKSVDEQIRKSKCFIRILMTTIFTSAIEEGETAKYCINNKTMEFRRHLMLECLKRNSSLELESLYALQAVTCRLGYPKGVLRTMFDILYDGDIISENAFIQWQTSKEEPDGKCQALRQVAPFFVWLKEAEDSNNS